MFNKFKNTFLILAAIFKTATAIQTFDHCINPGEVALTFNDGPSLEYTNTILDILEKENVKATFFISGEDCDLKFNEEAKQIIQREYNSGHTIASHTYSHPVGITDLPEEILRNDINKLSETIYDIIGVKPAFFRPPHGEYNDSSLKVLKQCNMKANILWNLDSEDWNKESNPLDRYKKIMNNLDVNSNSFITLNHDTEKRMALIDLHNIIQFVKESGYRFVTMDQCIGLKPYQTENEPLGKRNNNTEYSDEEILEDNADDHQGEKSGEDSNDNNSNSESDSDNDSDVENQEDGDADEIIENNDGNEEIIDDTAEYSSEDEIVNDTNEIIKNNDGNEEIINDTGVNDNQGEYNGENKIVDGTSENHDGDNQENNVEELENNGSDNENTEKVNDNIDNNQDGEEGSSEDENNNDEVTEDINEVNEDNNKVNEDNNEVIEDINEDYETEVATDEVIEEGNNNDIPVNNENNTVQQSSNPNQNSNGNIVTSGKFGNQINKLDDINSGSTKINSLNSLIMALLISLIYILM